MRRRGFLLIVGGVALFSGIFLFASVASAHKLSIFAAFSGSQIEGYLYTSSGKRLSKQIVQILNARGQVIDSVLTSDSGDFVYRPTIKQDLLFVFQTEDGHRAEYKLGAEEFPNTWGTEEVEPTAGREPVEQMVAQAPVPQTQPKTDLDVILRQLWSIQARLDELKNQIWLHDILGGVGYIFGVFGISYYLAAKRLKP